MPHSLRTFLDSIDNRMLHIHDPVDPLTQVGYLCSESQGPLMFHNMTGFPDWRLTDILIKDRAGQAAAFGLDRANEVCPYLAEQMATKRGKSVMVTDGPVKEVKMLGDDIDLHALPIPQHSHGDGGRYLGSGITITKDPETGIRNEAIIRMMLTDDPQKATFWMAARHNYAHYMKYVAMDEPMPMAFAIGLHPVYEIMSNWSGKHEDFDELEYGAGILGENIEMIMADTIDLEVPAHAEVVIEGLVHPKDRAPEGPFGEFTTFGAGAEGPAPVFQITGHQPLITLPMEATYYNRLKETHGNTNILDVFVPPWASQFMMIIQMEAKWDGQVRDTLLSALTGPNLHVKIVIAVDEDVDIYNAEEVLWAIACRCDPQTMTHMLPGSRLHPLDISIPQVKEDYTVMRVGGKLAIDATKPATWRGKERDKFDRVRPMGKGDETLNDLLAQVRVKR